MNLSLVKLWGYCCVEKPFPTFRSKKPGQRVSNQKRDEAGPGAAGLVALADATAGLEETSPCLETWGALEDGRSGVDRRFVLGRSPIIVMGALTIFIPTPASPVSAKP